ncbi:hypothetical protein, partial [Niveibacterium sp.]|uniref:hypothetical protein n=1 Tax=Niveibacterium sp. TaxID=2017444 RepID=UPI0035B105F0
MIFMFCGRAYAVAWAADTPAGAAKENGILQDAVFDIMPGSDGSAGLLLRLGFFLQVFQQIRVGLL